MEFSTFRKILDRLNPINITLSGIGEPLMNHEIYQMIEYAEQRGISINLTINGTMLNPETASKLIQSRLSLLSVSLDAAKDETFEKIRLGAKHSRVVSGLMALMEAKRRAGSSLPMLRAQFVLSRLNLPESGEFVRFSKSIGAGAVYFQPLCLKDSDHHLRNVLINDLSAEELLHALKTARTVSGEVHMQSNLTDLIDNFPLYWKKYVFEEQPKNRKCILPWFSTYITFKGDVIPCCSLNEEAKIGNLFEQDFLSIWQGERYRKLRKSFREGKRPFNICRYCVPVGLGDILLQKEKFTPGFLKLFHRAERGQQSNGSV